MDIWTEVLVVIRKTRYDNVQSFAFVENQRFVSDLRHIDGFLRFPPPIKLTATIYVKYC
jgi:hypothetical protein